MDDDPIFIRCVHGSAGQGIKYCMGRVCRIRRIVIEYSFTVYIGQPDGVSNIVSVVLSD